MAASPSPPSSASKVPVARLNIVGSLTSTSTSTSPPPKAERRATDGATTSTTSTSSTSSSTSSSSPIAAAIKNAAAASLWIALSATVILFNKHILAFSGFPFPISLTAFHMMFSWACSAALVRCTSLVELPTTTTTTTKTTTKAVAAAPGSSPCSRDAERDPLKSSAAATATATATTSTSTTAATATATTTTTTTIRGLDADTYLRRIAPVGALFAGTLWLGNAAYLHLSVSLVQMLKALMPAAVYSVGCVLGTEEFKKSRAVNMAVVTLGVAAASAGEVSLSALGVALQLGSIATESTRLALVQILLQQKKKTTRGRGNKKTTATATSISHSPSAAAESKKESNGSSSSSSDNNSNNKISLNPVTTMYYLAPASLLCLSLPWLAFERAALAEAWSSGGGDVSSSSIPLFSFLFSWWRLQVSPLTLVANASLAFALNLSVFLLIGRTSALAMNVAGVVKDWLLIGLSALLFHAPVTTLNLLGYSVAFAGVCWYNKAKFDEMKEEAAAKAADAAAAADEARSGGGTTASSELKPLVASSSRGGAGLSSAAVASSPSSEERKIKAGRAV